jgi:hypothetical protein
VHTVVSTKTDTGFSLDPKVTWLHVAFGSHMEASQGRVNVPEHRRVDGDFLTVLFVFSVACYSSCVFR